MKKILVVAAHPDDELLGCGGTIRRLVNEGNDAYCLILSDGVTSRYDKLTDNAKSEIDNRLKESLSSAKIIGYKELFFCNLSDNSFDKEPLLQVVKIVEKYIQLLKPTAIFTHHYGDLNIDHKTTFNAVQTATRPMADSTVEELYCFETFSATEWNFLNSAKFVPNYFVNIEYTIKTKLEALKCYNSELRNYPHPRSLEGLEVAAKRWGTVCGCNYAEAFECIRKVIN